MNEIKNENIKNVNEEIVVEGYANCSGDEDYRCDHDCVILGNPVISSSRLSRKLFDKKIY